MSNYSSEAQGCTCDTPTGSEARRCSYCKDQSNSYKPSKKKKAKKKNE